MQITCDLETDGLLEEVTKIHCIVAKDLDTGEITKFRPHQIEAGLTFINSSSRIIGHNFQGYDIEVIEKLYPSFKYKGVVRDTLILSHLVWPNLPELGFAGTFPNLPKHMIKNHNLESWGYRLGTHKGEFGKTTDWKHFSEEMLTYCVGDVEVAESLYKKVLTKNYSEEAIELEHQFARVMRMQEKYGFAFNRAKAVELYGILGQKRLELERELQQIFKPWVVEMKTPAYYFNAADSAMQFATKGSAGKLAKQCLPGPMKKKYIEFNPGSRDHISRALIERYGWKPLLFGKDGKPTVDEEVLETLVYPEVPKIVEYMMIEKRIGSLAEGGKAWLKLEKKGRIHGRVNTNGAISGRCTFDNPNMGQIVSTDKAYGPECRALFTVNEGQELVGIDAKGIQLRALAHYLAPFDGGMYTKIMLEGDPHTTNQNAAGFDTRDKAKTFIYAWLLGAGDEKAGEISGVTPEEVEKLNASPECVKVVAQYRKRFRSTPDEHTIAKIIKGGRIKRRFLKNLPALGRLKDEVEHRVKTRGYLIGLDGRQLPIRSAHAALSSLLQGFEACIMKRATIYLNNALHSKGYQHGIHFGFCAMVYDEWQMAASKGIGDEIGKEAVKAIELSGESFRVKCPVTGEYGIGRDWAETH